MDSFNARRYLLLLKNSYSDKSCDFHSVSGVTLTLLTRKLFYEQQALCPSLCNIIFAIVFRSRSYTDIGIFPFLTAIHASICNPLTFLAICMKAALCLCDYRHFSRKKDPGATLKQYMCYTEKLVVIYMHYIGVFWVTCILCMLLVYRGRTIYLFNLVMIN